MKTKDLLEILKNVTEDYEIIVGDEIGTYEPVYSGISEDDETVNLVITRMKSL